MEKIFALILCLTFVLSLPACSSNGTPSPNKDDETSDVFTPTTSTLDTEPCQHIFKEEVYKEPGYGVDGMKIKACTVCNEIEYIAVPALPDIFELTVTNKTVSTQGSECYVSFDIEIKNISDKKIKSISGTLTAMPPDCILELLCDFDDLSLEPYSTIQISSYGYSFDYDPSSNTVEKKVHDAEFENIKFYFSPSNVVVEE